MEKISVDRFIVWFRKKAGWSRVIPHPQREEDRNHRGKWVIPPVEGDNEGKTIYRINHALGKETRKRKREDIQDEYREIQHQLALQKIADLDRTNNVSRIPHDKRCGHYGGVEPINQLE